FEVRWLSWLARLTAFAANCNLMVSYFAYFWPASNNAGPRAITIVLVVLVLTAVNIIGVRQAAIASDLFTIGKLLPMLAFFVVCIGTLPELAKSTKPLADAGQRFMGTAGGALISAGAMISIAGNLNILVLSGSRIPFAIAERKQLPSFLAQVNRRFFTPHASIIITAAVMLVVTLKSSFVAALTISAIARLVTYAVTCAA